MALGDAAARIAALHARSDAEVPWSKTARLRPDERAPRRPRTIAVDDVEGARRLFRMMALIRRFEERTEEQYTRARIGGYCHLAIGEEAAIVGAIDALEDGRLPLRQLPRPRHRAGRRQSDPRRVMAELFGKETGVADGRGGSMHLLDVERHFLGGWGIVGGHLPIAVGAALALDYTRRSRTPCSASSATARPTPAPSTRRSTWPRSGTSRSSSRSINNQYGMGTSRRAGARPSPSCASAAAAYRMHGERVDGNDVLAVREAAGRLLRAGPRGAHAGAAGDDHLPLPRPLRGRRRQGLPHAEESRSRGASATRSPASGCCCDEQGCSTRGRPRARSGREVDEPRSRRRSARPPRRRARPSTASTSTSTATRHGASSSRRMARRRRRSASAGRTRSWRT